MTDNKPSRRITDIIRYLELEAIPALEAAGFSPADASRIAWAGVRARLTSDIKVRRTGRRAAITSDGRTYRIEDE